jgi:phosphatidylinositol alpha 1,6-mannosyltransferase
VRVAIVTESFLPQVNGVTNSVCRVMDQLARRGHEALLVAPSPGPGTYVGFATRLVPGVALPFYRSFTVGLPTPRVGAALREFRPDVVHLASPVVLGAAGAAAAARSGVPAVAVFQTDLAGFARQYGWRGTDRMVWSWLRHVHATAELTLAPSTATLHELRRRRFPRLARWPRGVDLERFHPGWRSERLRARLGGNDQVLAGYVGRLAAEKRPHLLGALTGLPGIRVVIVGDGPQQAKLRHLLPHAVFLGARTGQDLATIVASLDIFVHTGANETFCQAVQEALAAGVPVVAPAAGGLLDLITHGHNGLLYPPGDTRALRSAVSELAADGARRQAMGARARQSVHGRSWDAVCNQLLGHYQRAINGPAAADEHAGAAHDDLRLTGV